MKLVLYFLGGHLSTGIVNIGRVHRFEQRYLDYYVAMYDWRIKNRPRETVLFCHVLVVGLLEHANTIYLPSKLPYLLVYRAN